MSRITTTISIARQGPSAILIPAGGPAPQKFTPGANFRPKQFLACGRRTQFIFPEYLSSALHTARKGSSCIDVHPDGLLDLQTRDLAETKTVSGIGVRSGQDQHGLYAAPLGSSHSRNGSITNILGLSGGPQEVGETADGLLERLNLTVLHIADITGRDSRMGEGLFGNIFSGYRALGPHSSRSENRRVRATFRTALHAESVPLERNRSRLT